LFRDRLGCVREYQEVIKYVLMCQKRLRLS